MMAQEKTASAAGTVDPSKLRRGRGHPPSRAGSADSAVSRDEHAMLHHKLRNLRGKAGVMVRNSSDDSVKYTPKRQQQDSSTNLSLEQERDDQDKMGSNRSIKTHESGISTSSGGSAASAASNVVTGSFTVYGSDTPQASLKLAQDPAVANGSASQLSTLSPRPAPSNNRGLARRGAAINRTSQTDLITNSSNHVNITGSGQLSTKTNLTETSEHSNLSAASTTALERLAQRNGTRGRARGLGGRRQISTTRVVEPTLAPIVSTMGTVSPLVSRIPTRRNNGSGNSQASISPTPSAGRTGRSSATSSMSSPIPQPGSTIIPRPGSTIPRPGSAIPRPGTTCAGILDDNNNDLTFEQQQEQDQGLAGSTHRHHHNNHHSGLSSVTNHSNHHHSGSSSVVGNNSARVVDQSSTQMGSVSNRSGLRGRREASNSINSQGAIQFNVDSQPSTAGSASAARTPPRNALPTQVQEAQEQAEALYQPTEQDWTALYHKHVELLERKDLEIAMKLSTRPSEAERQAEDAAGMEGIELAIEVSRREASEAENNNPDEDQMLRLVMEMSRNDELESSFANASFVNDGSTNDNNSNNDNNGLNGGLGQDAVGNHGNDGGSNDNMLNIPYPSQQAKEPYQDTELERALRLSAQQPQQQALSEEEELERVLKLSQQEVLQLTQPAEEEDEELLRVLRVSQQEHEEEEQQRQQEFAEQGQNDNDEELLRILELSQQEARDIEKEQETMELVLKLSQMGEL